MALTLPETMTDFEKQKALIDAVCAVTTDHQALEIAKWWAMKPNGRAAAHLNRYLNGTGGTQTVDLDALLCEDYAVRDRMTTVVVASIKQGQTSGTIPIPQGLYRDQDWRNALGGINIQWQLGTPPTAVPVYKPGNVKIWFKNKYQWHPNEPRTTQALHQAAERLKKKGAQDFWVQGEAILSIH